MKIGAGRRGPMSGDLFTRGIGPSEVAPNARSAGFEPMPYRPPGLVAPPPAPPAQQVPQQPAPQIGVPAQGGPLRQVPQMPPQSAPLVGGRRPMLPKRYAGRRQILGDPFLRNMMMQQPVEGMGGTPYKQPFAR